MCVIALALEEGARAFREARAQVGSLSILRKKKQMVNGDNNWSKARVAEELAIPLESVTESLLRRIADDPTFLYHLEVCRSDPQMMAIVMAETDQPSRDKDPINALTNARLLTKAGLALARWSASGFDRVHPEEHARRLRVCYSCEHLSSPANLLVYKLTSRSDSKSICGLCGCDVRRKAWLITETCPDKSKNEGGRWQTS